MCGVEYEICDCSGCSGCGRSLEDAIDAHHDRECEHPADCDQCGQRVASQHARVLSERDAALWSAWASLQEPGVVTSDDIPSATEVQPSTTPGTPKEAP